jgi:hypothetical protein
VTGVRTGAGGRSGGESLDCACPGSGATASPLLRLCCASRELRATSWKSGGKLEDAWESKAGNSCGRSPSSGENFSTGRGRDELEAAAAAAAAAAVAAAVTLGNVGSCLARCRMAARDMPPLGLGVDAPPVGGDDTADAAPSAAPLAWVAGRPPGCAAGSIAK